MQKLKSKAQFLYDADGNKTAVLLDIRVYQQLLEDLEMKADVEAFDKAKPVIDAEIARGEFITIETYTEKWKQRHKKKQACVGKYRVIYEIADKIRLVTIEEIGHRKDIYR
jgi:mRNA-degrading endonuclease RelE of RelBE toxin-antitoxin system